jgi:hypothetical protein
MNESENNSRVIYEFCIGIPISNSHENFKNAVYDITQEITKITDGLTYDYACGTWKNENQIERNYTVRISIIVLPDTANYVYNFTKDLISNANKKYNLGINHVQVLKTSGYAAHFVCL